MLCSRWHVERGWANSAEMGKAGAVTAQVQASSHRREPPSSRTLSQKLPLTTLLLLSSTPEAVLKARPNGHSGWVRAARSKQGTQ